MNRIPILLALLAIASPVPAQTLTLRAEVEALQREMMQAFREAPASVARFYTADAIIVGGGQRSEGAAQVEAYWRNSPAGAQWTLEVIDVGGSSASPWVRGRSTLGRAQGPGMTVEYIGILRRGEDGKLRFAVDMYVRASASVSTPAAAAASASASAQSSPASPGNRPGMRAAREVLLATPRVEIPLVRNGQFYYLDVRINGRPFRFTLETGASFAAIGNRVAEQLGFPRDTTPSGRGIVSMRPGMPVVSARLDSLTMGGATYRDMEVRVTSAFDGMDFDGIISIPFLRDLLWTLDLGRSRLVFERGALPAVNGADIVALPGRDMAGRVDIPLAIGDLALPAVVDTRYSDWIMMNDSLAGTLRLAAAPRPAGRAMGPSVGAFEMRGARLDGAVRLGRYSLPAAPLIFRNRGGTIVGNAFLEQFTITFDQTNGRARVTRASPQVVVPPQPWEETDGVKAKG